MAAPSLSVVRDDDVSASSYDEGDARGGKEGKGAGMTTCVEQDTALSFEEAQSITSEIRSWVRAYPKEAVAKAYLGRIWLAMGYEDWAEWCDCELDGFKLPAVERREVVADLAEHGLSNRAIASAIGVNKDTVRNDKRDIAAGGEYSPPDSVIGQDGKTYQKPTPKHPDEVVPGFTADDLADMEIDAEVEKPWRHAIGEPDEQQRRNGDQNLERLKAYLDVYADGVTGESKKNLLDYLKQVVARMER